MQWSSYQERIFNFVATQKGNAIIEAVAGSGKTTTIVEALNRCKGTTIFLAFNKSISEELKKRGVNARTFHSLTCSPVIKAKDGRDIETNKLRRILDEKFPGAQVDAYGSFVCRLVGLARQAGVGCLIEDTESHWADIVEHHDLELDTEQGSMAEAISIARDLLGYSNAHDSYIDFDDMLYLAVLEGVTLPKFDNVFVDEAQDTNAIQRAILRKIMKKASRLIAVGDPAQAIYGFRGADSESMNLIKQEFECESLPLTVSYRCPKKVVAFARQWVKHIEPAPTAIDGNVIQCGQTWTPSQMQAGDLVVCRTTRPLISLGYTMLRSKIPFFIMGREIGAGLKSLITRQRAKSIESLLEKLAKWNERECEKARAKKQEAKIQQIQDKYESVCCLISEMGEGQRTVQALINTIDQLFSEKKNAVVLATIHKAKGLEAHNVWWLNSSKCPPKWAKDGWQMDQEINLCYVATTRAKNTLYLIEEREG